MRLHILAAALGVALAAVPARAGESAEAWARWTRSFAESLERNGQYDDAIEEWLALGRLRPFDTQPLSRAAVLAVETPGLRGGKLTPDSRLAVIADKCVAVAVSRGELGDPGLAYALGRLRFAQQKWGEAWKLFREATELGFDPVLARHWSYRATVNRAAMLVSASREFEAIEELKALRKRQPGHPEEDLLLVNLASAHAGKGMQEPQVAMEILEDLLRRRPDNTDARYLLGLILTDQGRLDEAVREFRETMLRSTSGSGQSTYRNALLRMSEAYIKLGDLTQAEQCANDVLAVDKDDPEGRFALGRVQQARGDPKSLESALRNFRRAARRMRDKVDVEMNTLMSLKQVLAQVDEKAEAEEVQKRIDELRRRRAGEIDGETSAPSPTPSAPSR